MPFAELPFDHALQHTPAIWHPEMLRVAWGRVRFRRRFVLDQPLPEARLWFSGSMRAELSLDGEVRSRGPTRSDPQRWHAVAVDLGGLAAGEHELTVDVAHFGASEQISAGAQVACAQMGPPAFLIVCGEGPLAGLVGTDGAWEARRDAAYGTTGRNARSEDGGYFPLGWGEAIDLAAAEAPWLPARQIASEAADLWGNLPLKARLRPQPLPEMAERPLAWRRLAVGAAGIDADGWAAGREPVRIPAGRELHLVLDAGTIVNAWPTITLSGGAGAVVDAVWAEAPHSGPRIKVHRDRAEGSSFPGFLDRLHAPGGGATRSWSPAWLRSFRYLDLRIRTAGEALAIAPVRLSDSAFPMAPPADLDLAGPAAADWSRIFAACWNTIRSCSHESIWDCPHWEQCQFPGDTRFTAMWHYGVCGEDRLGRKAIDDFHASQLPDGMIQCRWPSNLDQILPTFALHWVLMIGEFLRWRGDPAFLAGYLHRARAAVSWFLDRQRPDGLIGFVPHAPFLDWAPAFRPYGNAPQLPDGGSATIAAMTAQACAALARLEEACGWPELAPRWRSQQARLNAALRQRCWDAGRQLFSDLPGGAGFSVHAQIEAAEAGALPPADALAAMDRAWDAADVAQAGTMFYHSMRMVTQRRFGAGSRVHQLIAPWLHCLDTTGLNTLPETLGENPRSDCHAWSALPGLELFTAVLGLEPAEDAIGSDRMLWRPALGGLDRIAATVPHPRGAIRVAVERRAGGVHGEIDTPVPVAIAGRELPPGRHAVDLPAG